MVFWKGDYIFKKLKILKHGWQSQIISVAHVNLLSVEHVQLNEFQKLFKKDELLALDNGNQDVLFNHWSKL